MSFLDRFRRRPEPGSLTTDRNDPRLAHGIDDEPTPQAEAYLVLPEGDRADHQRPVRTSYRHVGSVVAPEYPTRPLTPEEEEQYAGYGYVLYEEYPVSRDPVQGKFWTDATLHPEPGCGTVTTMSQALAETYAAKPGFYGATYCSGCSMHRPVAEFIWEGTTVRVGS